MRVPPPAIRDYPTFVAELDRALALLDTRVPSSAWWDATYRQIRAQLLDAKAFTRQGEGLIPSARCPTDSEISRITFGQVAAREMDDDPELAGLLGRLSDYLHQWPRGVDAPSWGTTER